MKRCFTLLELLFVLVIMSGFLIFAKINYINNDLQTVSKHLILHLKNLRYQALIDNKYSYEDKWYKKRWTLKFLNCNKSIGGIYYIMFSDLNMKGHANQSETLKDALNSKYLYATSSCKENKNRSKHVLLSKNYNIKEIKLSCNKTKSLGQISFSSSGKIYASLSNQNENNEIKKDCYLEIIHQNNDSSTIVIRNTTGYVSLYSK